MLNFLWWCICHALINDIIFSTAGAMRLPLTADKERDVSEMLHYLTDYYAVKKFDLDPISFNNHSGNAFYNFYGNPIKMKGKIVNNYTATCSCQNKIPSKGSAGKGSASLNDYHAMEEQGLDNVQYVMHYGCVSSQVITIHNYADYEKNAPSVMNEYWPGWNTKLVESGLYGHEKGKIDTMGKCEIIIILCNCLMKLLVKHISCSMKLDYCSSTGESCYLLIPICFF